MAGMHPWDSRVPSAAGRVPRGAIPLGGFLGPPSMETSTPMTTSPCWGAGSQSRAAPTALMVCFIVACPPFHGRVRLISTMLAHSQAIRNRQSAHKSYLVDNVRSLKQLVVSSEQANRGEDVAPQLMTMGPPVLLSLASCPLCRFCGVFIAAPCVFVKSADHRNQTCWSRDFILLKRVCTASFWDGQPARLP